MKLLSGSANRPLAEKVASLLGTELGTVVVKNFADGETFVELKESVRGEVVYLIQPTSPPDVNANLMELLLTVSACRRASASKVIAVIPYFGYARQARVGCLPADQRLASAPK